MECGPPLQGGPAGLLSAQVARYTPVVTLSLSAQVLTLLAPGMEEVALTVGGELLTERDVALLALDPLHTDLLLLLCGSLGADLEVTDDVLGRLLRMERGLTWNEAQQRVFARVLNDLKQAELTWTGGKSGVLSVSTIGADVWALRPGSWIQWWPDRWRLVAGCLAGWPWSQQKALGVALLLLMAGRGWRGDALSVQVEVLLRLARLALGAVDQERVEQDLLKLRSMGFLEACGYVDVSLPWPERMLVVQFGEGHQWTDQVGVEHLMKRIREKRRA